nr:reverse transcriptase domain-containing protein [Tanacetum cinerariifolium]
MFLGKYFPPSMVTKLRNEITNFHQRPDESLFEAWECYKLSIDRCPNHNMFPVTQIDTFYNSLTLRHRDTINAVARGTFMKRRPKECYDLIENMTAHHNDWDTSAQRSESSSSITSSFDTEIAALKAKMAEINKNLIRPSLARPRTCLLREPIKGNNQRRNQFFQEANQGQNQPPAYQAPVYQAPVHQPQIPQPQVVTTNEFTNFMKASDAILKNMQTNVTSLTNSNLELKNVFGQFMKMNTASSSGSRTLPCNIITNPKEELKGITIRRGTAYQGPTIPTTSSSLPPAVELVSPIIEPVASPVSAPKPNQRPLITYLSKLQDQKLRDKANDQREKFFQIFNDLYFYISFADALILMPKFGPSIKSLLTNKGKLCELARTPLNEHCSVVLLKKFPEKLGDPGKFLILCDFPRIAECLALANLDASINLMPLSVWNNLSLPDLSPTCMNLELADRSISRLVRFAKDVFVKVGTFHFPADFVVIDFDVDPRVPLILERSFLKTGRALIDVFEGELTLRVGKEAITFNLDQTSRYLANYNDMTENRIDVIDMACEEYLQEVLNFSNVIASGNPTPYYDPIVSTTSLTLTPFRNSDFLLEEVNVFLALEDDPTSLEFDQSHELKICEDKFDKSSIDEPPEVELKDLPPHLEYVFLEGNDKLSVIIAKDLSIEEKTALITVLKSHKRAIAWKLSNIKGTDPEFCTHKILMEEDFEPTVQHQRRVNPKIHNVIKIEVLKLLDDGLIYSISDSPWVILVHCVPKKGGFTVLENELIPTRLVTGWRVCIDYRKLNEATGKDHFPLPFMDQMLKRLARNQYYCFLDSFSGYFQISIDLKDQEKTTFTCPYETFAYCRMPFRLCNAPVFGSSFHPFGKDVEVDMPFELMCDASDFVIGAVLGQRQEKNFRTIHYAVIDTKGAEKQAADHLSRLENPHQNVVDPKEINESFPLETLNLVSSRGNSSTPWFAEFANYHAGNFVVKGMSSQQKNKFFKDVKRYF